MELRIEQSPIPGLIVVRMPVHGDDRGWFKENWQRQKMVALGLPDFAPVQNNVAYNRSRGVTRGFHAEPWDKYVSVAAGRVRGAWVDLREGPSFGSTFDLDIDPSTAVFVPRGVGNAYQTLEDHTAYVYLVNEHWHPDAEYVAVALDDPQVGAAWPIPLDSATISDKDRHNPGLAASSAMRRRRTVILGAGGQVGRALAAELPDAEPVPRSILDVTDAKSIAEFPWSDVEVIVNAAAYTAVDAAETADGRSTAWATNANAPAMLADMALRHRCTLIHFSTDYVYDGVAESHHEDAPLAPLNVYGQSKAAGDLAVARVPRHYILRTSWVIGEGHNFVRTMQRLASEGVSPSVIDDQWGRLTFASELARAVRHLLEVSAPYGTYHVTNAGPPTNWADVAAAVFQAAGRRPDEVQAVSTDTYTAGRTMAPRPRHSTLDLGKLRETGFEPEDAMQALRRYLTT